MERKDIITKLRTLIVENLELEAPDELKEENRLFEDLNIDSIMILQLIVYLEEEFDVSIPENEIDPEVFESVGTLVSFIQEKGQAN